MFQKILVPLDFSDYTDEMMNVAEQLARLSGFDPLNKFFHFVSH